MAYAVECMKVSKKFKDFEALKDISLNIEENKIYGFLGRNGAGKTTILNIITTHLFNDEGSVKVFGEVPFENEKILNKICFVKDKLSFMTWFKVNEIFDIAADFFENWDEKFKEELVDEFELDVNKRYKELSKGMESMVSIIIGLASRAPLTIFDEVYLGLDAGARQLFYEILFKDYLEHPRTIIFSTHLIEEVSNIFENIIIVHKGRVLLQDEKDNILDKAIEITGDKEKLEIYLNNKNVLKIEAYGNLQKAYIFERLDKDELSKIKFKGLEARTLSLEELFIQITAGGKAKRGSVS